MQEKVLQKKHICHIHQANVHRHTQTLEIFTPCCCVTGQEEEGPTDKRAVDVTCLPGLLST